MIGRVSGVVPIQRHRRKARIRPQQLAACDGRGPQRRVRRNLPEKRIRHLLRQLRTERQLLDRQLIEVHVRHAQARQLGPQIAGFDAPVRCERLLQSDVPLLRVSAAVVALHAEHALAESRIRVRRLDRHRRALRQHERRMDVVERLLAQRLDERKQRRRKRSRDARLLDPSHAVSCANHKRIRHLVRDTQAWREVLLLEIASRARSAVRPEIIQLLRLQVEHCAAIIHHGRREVQRVSNAEVQSQPPRRAPVVLQEKLRDLRSRLQNLGLRVDAEASDLSRQERCKRVARVRRHCSRRRQSSGEDAGELKVPRRTRRLQHIERLEPDVRTCLQTVAAANQRVVVDELRHRSREIRIPARRRTELLEPHDVISRQHIGKRTRRNIRDERRLRQRLRDSAGSAIELAARVAEAELVHRRRRQGERMLRGHAIRACEGVADHAGGQIPAAVRKRRRRPAVVAQERITSEHTMAGPEVAVEPSVELIRYRVVVANPPVVIRRRLCARGSYHVGRRIPFHHGRCRAVDPRNRDRVAREWIPQISPIDESRRCRIENRRGKHAAPLRRSRHGARSNHAGIQSRTLPVRKEERLVLLHRTAQHKPVLIPAKARFGARARREQVPRIQLLIAKELEERPVKLVRTRLLVHHDHAAVRAAVFRRVAVHLDAKLIDRVDDRIERHLSRLRLQHADAVVNVFADARAASVDAGQQVARRQIHARRQRDQRHEVAAIQRQRYDLLLFHHETHRAPAHLQQRSRRSHLDGLAGAADLQFEIEARAVAHTQHDPIPRQRREPFLRNGQTVRARRQRQKQISAVIPCHRRRREPRRYVDQPDLRRAHRQPGSVANSPQQFRLCRLSASRGTQKAKARHGRRKKPRQCSFTHDTVMLTRHLRGQLPSGAIVTVRSVPSWLTTTSSGFSESTLAQDQHSTSRFINPRRSSRRTTSSTSSLQRASQPWDSS